MVFNNNLLLGAGGQSTGPAPFDPTLIGNSVWLDGSSDQLEMAKTSGGSASSKFTVSCWIQRNEFSEGTFAGIFGHFFSSSAGVQLYWSNSNTLVWNVFSSISGSGGGVTTSEVFRDIGWYHILANYDGTNGTMQLFVNGEYVGVDTFTAGSTNPIGSGTSGATYYWGAIKNTAGTIGRTNSYLAQCALELGTAAVPSDYVDTFTFGTNGSQIIPKNSSDLVARIDSAGGHSHLLDFANSSDLGNDISSNNNDFTATSMSSANQTVHTPSLVYPVWNILEAAATLSNGNLNARSTSSQLAAQATQSVSSGKFYWEITANNSANQLFGITGEAVSYANRIAVAFNYTPTVFFYGINGNIYQDGSSTAYDSAISAGDVIGIAVDFDAGKIWFAKNNTWLQSGDPANGTSPSATFTVGTFTPSWCAGGASGDRTGAADFGQLGFTYTPPTGFVSLNSENLTAPDYQGIDYFDATLYEGNGTGQRVGDFVPFTDAYTVANSAMFDSTDLRYLARTPSSGGNEKTLTFSTWIKITGVGNSNENAVLTTDDGSKEAQIRITGTTLATKKVQANLYNGSSFVLSITTDRTFGDSSSWNHLVVAYDTRAAVASADKVIIYINGVRQSVSGTLLTVDDYETEFNSTNEHNIGRQTNNAIGEPDFYLAETVMIDGQQLDASSFGQLDTSTNRWIPKDVSGLTFGTNGFYLEYESTFGTGSGAGTDTSGNSNNWTESTDGGSAWATTDQFTDTPSKNYPIFSRKNIGSATATLTEGNLKYTGADNGGFPITMQPTSGKWYFEVEIDTAGNYYPGLFTAAGLSYTSTSAWAQTSSFVYLTSNANGAVYNGSTVVNGYNTGALSSGDRLAIAWDVDNRLIYYGLASGGSTTFFSSGDPAARTGAAPFDLPNERLYFGVVSGGSSNVSTHHFISSGWEGAAPTGFSELNQDNLDDTASKITALAWIKNRDATDNHMLFDRVRGVGKDMHSNDAAAEVTNANTVQRFLQRGVQIGSDVEVNTANESYVLWQWLLGDSATTGSANTDGSITSTVIAADAGHSSIGTYTGTGANATIGHGLSGAPELVIVKNTNDNREWRVLETVVNGGTHYLTLSRTAASTAGSTFWNNSNPTASVINLGSDTDTNDLGDTMLAISFRSVPGVCKVGSYVGNLNADGPYIDLGFTPRFFLVKITDGINNWGIFDTARNTFNVSNRTLNANDATVEDTSYPLDILSNGIKIRGAFQFFNDTGKTYIYLAMADIGGNGTLPPIYGR